MLFLKFFFKVLVLVVDASKKIFEIVQKFQRMFQVFWLKVTLNHSAKLVLKVKLWILKQILSNTILSNLINNYILIMLFFIE